MVTINTAQQNRAADEGILFDGGTAKAYTGSKPASANSAASGTLLGTITLPTPAHGAAVAGVRAKAGDWEGEAVADGEVGYVRLVSATGDRRMDFEAVTEVTMANYEVVEGGALVITGCTITMPSGE